MSGFRICALNEADAATITATTANSSYPATNLQDPSRTTFRTTDASANRKIYLTWADARRINFVALLRHNLTGSAAWRVELWSNADWTGAVEDSGSITAFDATLLGRMMTRAGVYDERLLGLKNSVYYTTALRTTIKSITITISDTGNADGYLEAVRCFTGEYLGLTRNAAFGAGCEWMEDAATRRRRSGALRTTARLAEQYRRWTLPMPPIDSADRALLSEISWYAGERKDMWLDMYPADATILGIENRGLVKFVARGRLAHVLPSHWQTDFTLEEA